MIIGISFMATPVKFQAKTLELGPALDVGRHTFTLFNHVECLLLPTLTVIYLLRPSPRSSLWLLALLWGIVMTQRFWLLPELVTRVEAVIAGSPRPPSPHHAIYAALEVIKLLTAASISIRALLRLTRPCDQKTFPV
ncbi:MAG: hypothetical protein AAF492_02255 [Verrucomicrobiota bacterium]